MRDTCESPSLPIFKHMRAPHALNAFFMNFFYLLALHILRRGKRLIRGPGVGWQWQQSARRLKEQRLFRMCVAFLDFEPQLARLLLVCMCAYIYLHIHTHIYTYPPTDGERLRGFYQSCMNSILQQLQRKLWKIAEALF